MKTDAVICIALQRTRPSRTPLFATTSSTLGVMFSNAIRAGKLNVKYSVRLFIVCSPQMTGPGPVGRLIQGSDGNGKQPLSRTEKLPVSTAKGVRNAGGFFTVR